MFQPKHFLSVAFVVIAIAAGLTACTPMSTPQDEDPLVTTVYRLSEENESFRETITEVVKELETLRLGEQGIEVGNVDFGDDSLPYEVETLVKDTPFRTIIGQVTLGYLSEGEAASLEEALGPKDPALSPIPGFNAEADLGTAGANEG